jgi:hypothetical protein
VIEPNLENKKLSLKASASKMSAEEIKRLEPDVAKRKSAKFQHKS